MKDVTHIERSLLPWQAGTLTECGLDASRHPTWTRTEAVAKAREYGRQRFAMVVCMTCANTAERHATWEQDPASCLNRYTSRLSGRSSYETRNDDDDRARFAAELRAIALLVDAHRDEFDTAVQGLLATPTLADQRRARKTRTR